MVLCTMISMGIKETKQEDNQYSINIIRVIVFFYNQQLYIQ